MSKSQSRAAYTPVPRTVRGLDLFDYDRFFADAKRYLARSGKTQVVIARETGIPQWVLYKSHKNRMSLQYICMLASICDLSLDSYMREYTLGMAEDAA